ncbi:unnamed protein product [Caenorhabditis auriculariae]|uniref:Uncharacterized protein n=1 Tax=Caenorhabditis auriculariae TaxID=2777116 RepID=A0A8S1H069_9PELO|nr:unnamed protein product [Caenorhabditis auriculariae]
MTKTQKSAILIPALPHRTVAVERPPSKKSFMRAPARQKKISAHLMRKFEREADERRIKALRAALEQEKKTRRIEVSRKMEKEKLLKAAEVAEKKHEPIFKKRPTSHCSIVLQQTDTNAVITLKKPLSNVNVQPITTNERKDVEDGPTRKLPHSAEKTQGTFVTKQKFSDSNEQSCKSRNIQPIFGDKSKHTEKKSALDRPCKADKVQPISDNKPKLPNDITKDKRPLPAGKDLPTTEKKIKMPENRPELKFLYKTEKKQSTVTDESKLRENESTLDRPYKTNQVQSTTIDKPQASTIPAINQIDQVQAQNPAQAAPPAPVRALAQAEVVLDRYVYCPGKAHSHKPIYGKLKKSIPRKRWNGKLVTNCRSCGFFPVYLLPYCEASGPLIKGPGEVPSVAKQEKIPPFIINIGELRKAQKLRKKIPLVKIDLMALSKLPTSPNAARSVLRKIGKH